MDTPRAHPLFSAILVAGICALPSSAGASGPRVGIAAFGGYNSYSMGNIIGEINAVLADSGLSLKEISGGASFGIGVRVWPWDDEFLLAVDLIRLQGSTDVGVPGGTLGLEAPANAAEVTAAGFLSPARKIRLGLGIGAGYYVADSNLNAEVSGEPSESVKFEGRGHGIHIVGLVSFGAFRSVDLEAAIGYRYVKTNGLKIDGEEFRGEGGYKQQIDWSGFLSRVGLVYYVAGSRAK
jgi:hypothetical protein